jgi:hypothetical protein
MISRKMVTTIMQGEMIKFLNKMINFLNQGMNKASKKTVKEMMVATGTRMITQTLKTQGSHTSRSSTYSRLRLRN